MIILFLLLAQFNAQILKFEEDITKLEETHLGKTFLDTVQIAVQSKEPLDRVFQILRDQAVTYENEFLSLDERHKSTSQKCSKDLSDFDNMNALLKARLVDLQSTIDEKQPEKLKKIGLLSSKRNSKSNLTQRLDELQLNRQKQKCMYEARMEEHQIAMSAVVAVREIFEGAIEDQEESSFVSLQEDDIDKVQTLLSYASSKASDFLHLQGYSSFFAVLEQLNVPQLSKHLDSIKQLVETCTDLENYIEIARSLVRSVDDIREQYYQRLYDNIHADMRDLNASIDELETEIAALEAQIKVLDMDKEEIASKYETKSKQKIDRQNECDQDDSVYQFKLAENQRERETIQRILNLCLDNVKELKQYIKKRGDSFYKV